MAEANINQIVSDREQFKGEIETLADRIRNTYRPDVLPLASLMLSTRTLLQAQARQTGSSVAHLLTQMDMMLTLWTQTHGVDEAQVAAAVEDMYRAGQTAELLSAL